VEYPHEGHSGRAVEPQRRLVKEHDRQIRERLASANLDSRRRRIVRSTSSTFLPSAHPIVHLDAIVFGCSGGRRRSIAADDDNDDDDTIDGSESNQQSTRSAGSVPQMAGMTGL
jgi:hypothetical protein